MVSGLAEESMRARKTLPGLAGAKAALPTKVNDYLH
jgi:hypothetical protein